MHAPALPVSTGRYCQSNVHRSYRIACVRSIASMSFCLHFLSMKPPKCCCSLRSSRPSSPIRLKARSRGCTERLWHDTVIHHGSKLQQGKGTSAQSRPFCMAFMGRISPMTTQWNCKGSIQHGGAPTGGLLEIDISFDTTQR